MNDSNSQACDNKTTATQFPSRRRWLQTAGGAAALLPIIHLTGCAEEAPKPSPAASKPAAAPKPAAAASPTPAEAVEAVAEEVAEAAAEVAPAAASGELIQIKESDPTAKALSYVHDASTVDKGKHPRFAAGQNCAGCAQYKGNDAEGWGGCAIFPGNLVADAGWCAGYIASS
ncbi:MAG: high-potential iron-sulfur protein [Pseudomonadales bacterium]